VVHHQEVYREVVLRVEGNVPVLPLEVAVDNHQGFFLFGVQESLLCSYLRFLRID
jgi:hypothetical protein